MVPSSMLVGVSAGSEWGDPIPTTEQKLYYNPVTIVSLHPELCFPE
jgi:hypothetical protein